MRSAPARLEVRTGAPVPFAHSKCRICTCLLNPAEEDDMDNGVCSSCKQRPEARRLGLVVPQPVPCVVDAPARPKAARDFTPAERALIRKVNGFMPAQQLLDLLNERLACDLGPDAMPYTMEQLYGEIGDAAGASPNGPHDWASLRKMLAKAARSGVLATISEQTINDFAVVFSLNPKQVLALKDIVLQAKEDAR